ncbi:MAG: hypothetical protein ACYTJ0_02355 [Planctomycetota bacterium]|jgi:uncharacterized membrane protein
MQPPPDAGHLGSVLGALVATTGSAETLFRDVVPWLAALLVLLVIGAFVIAWLRRVAHGGSDDGSATGFTLQDLRDMHAAGQLTNEEFQRARDEMIGRLRPTGDEPWPGKDR